MVKLAFKAAGAAIGGFIGGPQGAAVGAKAGGKVGGAVKGKKKKGGAEAPRIPKLDLSGLMSPVKDEGPTADITSRKGQGIQTAAVAASPFGNPAYDLMAQWDQVLRLDED